MTALTAMPKYETYKDSGIEWLGEIPAHWKVKKLKFSTLINKESLPENTQRNHILEYVDIGSVTFENGIEKAEDFSFGDAPSRARRLAKNGDTIVSTVRTYLKAIAFIDERYEKCVYSTGFAVITPKEDFSPKFLTNFIRSNAFTHQVDDVAKGMSYPAINSTDLSNLYIVDAPFSEQTTIAHFLDQKTAQIDAAIAIKEQQITLLKERKQILIQQAVTKGVGFGFAPPTRSQRSPRGGAGGKGGAAKDSGVEWIGEIPAHWEMKKVKHLFRMIMESSEKNNNHELLSVYTDIGVKPRRELEERGNKASTTDGYWFVKKGDIVVNKLLAWMGAIGLSEYDGVTSPAYDILRPKVEINGYFYHFLFRSDFCSSELKRHSRGIMDMRLRLYFDKFGLVEVPYPSATEQNKIIDFLNINLIKMDEGIDLINQQIEKLREYKTTLINSAVTGKIKIA